MSGEAPLRAFPRLAAEAQAGAAGQAVELVGARRIAQARPSAPRSLAASEGVRGAAADLPALPASRSKCRSSVDRSFRFVADEDTAAALDDEAEEDVLALSRSFDLLALVEDELLMALPVVPRHEVCPRAGAAVGGRPGLRAGRAAREPVRRA